MEVSVLWLKTTAGETEKLDQDLKKKILKLEFCLQETRSQTRKLNRVSVKFITLDILVCMDQRVFKILLLYDEGGTERGKAHRDQRDKRSGVGKITR